MAKSNFYFIFVSQIRRRTSYLSDKSAAKIQKNK